ncbi:NAD(P)-binding protein [Cryphonectria parasitica EP155]|uniref:NAD(P)-binding protein n=1 Tax=Cryphonectria parasitica (strain ATCC 38755 / EP155) TaxID=660469 RepID=A0A9P5CK62_CRYP1|nr:NAD(P)-binding protein [Cryphonectria parasitica EP155]KAF3761944.1 NAD(P)-binding protein [Cryphonectria parasitica EP155]
MASSPPTARHSFSWLTDAGYFNMQAHMIPLRSLPYPTTSYDGKTVLITGGNVGLGREAARHFYRLGAKRVILACRDVEKGRAAQADVETSSPSSKQGGAVEVWQVDLASFQSVKEFCRRADAELDRLDVVVGNAGIAIGTYVEADGGFESTIAINVVSTFLMVLLLLPLMRRTAVRFNVETKVVIVSSDSHMFARFREREELKGLEAFKGKENMNEDRYNTSKLLSIWIVREMAARMAPNDPVVLNCINPGFCRTELFRHNTFPLNYIVRCTLRLLGRTAEMGSRTVMAAAAAGRESHGQYMDSCVVRTPSKLVVSAEGQNLQSRVYEELEGVLEDIQPGITSVIGDR